MGLAQALHQQAKLYGKFRESQISNQLLPHLQITQRALSKTCIILCGRIVPICIFADQSSFSRIIVDITEAVEKITVSGSKGGIRKPFNRHKFVYPTIFRFALGATPPLYDPALC